MKDIKQSFSIIIFFKIFIFLQIINYAIMSQCDKENPFLKYGNCFPDCSEYEIDIGICEIENDIIKNQLNDIYKLPQDYSYTNIASSEKNNLYLISSQYFDTNLRTFYLLNHEGYPLINSSFYINDPLNKGRFESQTFTIKLYDSNDDNEYLVSLSKDTQNIEIYDFNDNNSKYYIAQLIYAFNITEFNYQLMGAHFKLKLAEKENKNSYLISFIVLVESQNII